MDKGSFALDILVVGLGQAGGKLAGEFYRRGYRALALNTAAADLRALDASGGIPLVPEEYRLNIGIEGFDGAGCDPSFGRSCVEAHADIIRSTVMKRSQGADMILLTAGLGGGTGSSLRALIDALQEQPLPLLALVTLPMRGENAIVKVNAVRALSQLTDANIRNLMIVDNARADELVRDASMSEYYAKVNQAIIEPIDQLNRLNSREDLQSLRSFDGEELRKLLLAGGVLNYGSMTIGHLTLQELNEAVHHCLRAGELMPPGFEPTNVSYLAVIISASTPTLAKVPMSVIDSFHQHWKAATGGGAVEVGIYSTKDANAPTRIWLLATSQSLPLEVQELVLEASREAATVRDKLKKSIVGIDVSGLDGMDILPTFERRVPPTSGLPDEATMQRSLLGSSRVNASQQRQSAQGEARIAAQQPTDFATADKTDGGGFPSQIAAAGNGGAASIVESIPNSRSTSAVDASASKSLKRQANPPSSVASTKIIPVQDRPSVAQSRPPGRSSDQDIDLSLDDEVSLSGHSSTGLPDAPVPPPLPLGAKGLPNPDVYEQLVEDFRGASTEEMRQEIAERLENDRFSEHAVVRYYVVKAMAQLDRKLFEMSLIAATEDENESVRALASIALTN